MRNPKNLIEVLHHHLEGGNFLYGSYDHDKALAEFKGTKAYQDLCQVDLMLGITTNKIDKSMIPEEIREKYAIKKSGKLRMVDFAPDGRIRKVHIGNKRPKSFYDWTESLANIWLI